MIFLIVLHYIFNSFNKKNEIIKNYKKFDFNNFDIENIFDIINNFFIKIFFIIDTINIFIFKIININFFEILILRYFFDLFFYREY